MLEVATERFLVDASVAVKWFDLRERYVDQARSLLDAHLTGQAHLLLSALLPYEVGNALLKEPEPTGPGETDALWLSDFVWVTIDAESAEATRSLALRYNLSYYDASYLALAIREAAPLVSDDQLLIDAAVAEGVGIALEEIPVT